MEQVASDRPRTGAPALGIAGFVLAILGVLPFVATFYIDVSNRGAIAVCVSGDAFMLAGLVCGVFGLRQTERQRQGWTRLLTYVGMGISTVGLVLYTGLVLFIAGQ